MLNRGKFDCEWTTIAFVDRSLKMKPGKEAGQVGHAMMRLGRIIPEAIYDEYMVCERKLIYKSVGLPILKYVIGSVQNIADDDIDTELEREGLMVVTNITGDRIWLSKVKDYTLDDYTTVAIFARSDTINTEGYRLR